jgi:hypothetical protein
MSQTFSYEFLAPGAPEEVESRVQAVITERLRRPTGGGARDAQRQMRLSGQTGRSLSYRPKLLAPLPVSLSIWLGRRLRGEKVELRFGTNGGDGQTHIIVSGKAGHGTQVMADREFWAAILSDVSPSG